VARPNQSFDRPEEQEPGEADSGSVALCASLVLDPRKIIASLRAMDGIERNDLIWGVLAGFVAPIFGSLLSVLVWGAFIWNAISAAIGRYPFRIGRIGVACTVTVGAYGAVKLGFTVAHSGLDGWRFWPAFLLFFAPAFFLFRQRMSDGSALFDLLVLGAGFSVVVAAPLAALETQLLDHRAQLLCGNANVFAVMAALFGSLGTLNALASSNRRRWLGLLAFLAMVFCVFVSGRRTMWLVMPFLAVIPLWAAARFVPRRMLWRSATATLIVMTIGIFAGSGLLWDRISDIGNDIAKIEQTQDYESSTGRRVLLWKGAWLAVTHAPLAGYGVAGRMDAVRAFVPEQHHDLVGFTHPHNAYLAALLDAGMPGLVALLAMLTAPVWLAAMAPRDAMWRPRLAAGVILTLCYAVSGATGIMFEHDLMDAAFVLVLIVIAASASDAEQRAMRVTAA
jgi:O-antigen ligase